MRRNAGATARESLGTRTNLVDFLEASSPSLIRAYLCMQEKSHVTRCDALGLTYHICGRPRAGKERQGFLLTKGGAREQELPCLLLIAVHCKQDRNRQTRSSSS